MCDGQHRESHVQLPCCTPSAPRHLDADMARMQHDEPGQEREEDLRRRLNSLQEFVCELLIQNQELRMSLLVSAATLQSGEAG